MRTALVRPQGSVITLRARHARPWRTTVNPDRQPGPSDEPQPTAGPDRVLDLRLAGSSYVSIARAVGLARAIDAFELFLRAVDDAPITTQRRIRRNELDRLAQLERKIRAKDGLTEAQLEHRLRCLGALRQRVLAIAEPR
jgi:hypothetical protein